MHLVVAHYNESLEWLSLIPDQWTIYVYSKGSAGIIPAGVQARTIQRQLENKGREGDTYLTHILGVYDTMPVAIAFVQGNPFDHCDRDVFIERLAAENTEDGLVPLCNQELHCNQVGEPHHPGLPVSMKAFQLGIPLRFPLTFAPGAQWIAGRNRIWYTSLEKYRQLSEWLLETPVNGYCLERMWPSLFGRREEKPSAPWVIYYTHHRVGDALMRRVWEHIWKAGAQRDKVIIIADRPDSRLPQDVQTYYMPVGGLGWQRAIFHKIRLALLQIPEGETVAMAEHDVLYPEGYFTRIAGADIQDDIVYYWKACMHVSLSGYEFFYSDENHTRTLLSGCFGERNLLLREINRRIAQIEVLEEGKEFSPFEPGLDTGWGFVDFPDKPILDVRHGLNATNTGTDKEYYEPLAAHAYWGEAAGLIETLK